MWALELTEDVCAALTSGDTDKEVVTEAPGATGLHARGQTMSDELEAARSLSLRNQ